MSNEFFSYIGTRHKHGYEEAFGISADDRRRHVYMIGKTGTGKTTLLRSLILQDVHAGRGVGILDPHGDLAEDLLDHIPPYRNDDVVYFNPADHDHPVSFNLVRSGPPQERHLVASGIVDAFKSIWRHSWGPRLEYILYAAVAALLDCENSSILGVHRMLYDEGYRRWVVKQIKDPAVHSFWVNEFDRYDTRYLREVISPIQNKVGQFFMASPVRNILGQVRNRIDPDYIMDHRRIFIANLSKGLVGADKSNLLGAMLVNQFYLAAMRRAGVPEDKRIVFNLYLDEFQNFSTDTFAAILSEARKYGLSLTLSHQYIEQLDPATRHAVFGNAGTFISFRVGGSDAKVLATEFDEEQPPGRFTCLANYEICVKPLVQGESQQSFVGKTVNVDFPRYRGRENIIRRSRERYTQPRGIVEDRIRRWLEND
jgi:hypothetical protein